MQEKNDSNSVLAIKININKSEAADNFKIKFIQNFNNKIKFPF